MRFFVAFLVAGLCACGKPAEPFDLAESPPLLPAGERVEIKSGGETVPAEVFRPDSADTSMPAIIVIHEWWGLNDQVRGEAQKLAHEGYLAIAVDLYRGRTAKDRDEAHQLSRGLPEDRALRDLKGAFAWLAARDDVDSIGVIGWCMGGGQALSLAISEPGLAGVVVYYGRLPSDSDSLAKIRAPVIGFYGEEDKGIPVADVKVFEKTLRDLGRDVEAHLYPGAGHAFANAEAESYRADAARDAWEKTLKFLKKHLR